MGTKESGISIHLICHKDDFNMKKMESCDHVNVTFPYRNSVGGGTMVKHVKAG